ncbi:MAG: trypsin-like peptidase domain-containing protein [Candidatus Riflebacteria bacterium]|nr:trypsin-like peptidase domain-containing protein [Candidatus Riflebacteria bacterium]
MHLGNNCPACGKDFEENEEAIICEKCSGVHHLHCWEEAGCSTYHCAPTARNPNFIKADIILTKSEVASVQTSSSGRVVNSERIAMEIESKAKRTSILSIFCALFGSLCFIASIHSLYIKSPPSVVDAAFLLFSTLGGVLSIILGTVSALRIQGNSNLKGGVISVFGILAGAFGLMLGFLGFWLTQDESGFESMEPVHFNSDQIKGFIDKASGNIKTPLMCNVHISAPQSFLEEAQGSGVCLKTIGKFVYVLSNLHVVTAGKRVANLKTLQENSKIIVTFYNGFRKLAEPVWLAPSQIDLVLLKVAAPAKLNLAAKVAPNRLPGIGEKVFAIGNPMGLNWSYTDGVVSAIRQQTFGPHEVSVIQMQTPLNPGNSGGGLYDKDGFLVGINTWIYAKKLSEGLNFSISMDGILTVMDPAIKDLLSLSDTAKSINGEENDNPIKTPSSGLSKNN